MGAFLSRNRLGLTIGFLYALVSLFIAMMVISDAISNEPPALGWLMIPAYPAFATLGLSVLIVGDGSFVQLSWFLTLVIWTLFGGLIQKGIRRLRRKA